MTGWEFYAAGLVAFCVVFAVFIRLIRSGAVAEEAVDDAHAEARAARKEAARLARRRLTGRALLDKLRRPNE